MDVGYFAAHDDKTNSFQLVIVDRSDVAPADFDILMNYDRIDWETGDASGGVGGFGGTSARVGFSNGVSNSFEMPGSAVPGSFLDANPVSGLVHGSRNSLQPGRYVFEVRNGAPPAGDTVGGHVRAGTAVPPDPVAAAFVQVCEAAGGCVLTTTDATGSWSIDGLHAGAWTVTAYPPAGNRLLPGSVGPLALPGTGVLIDASLLLESVPEPPPGAGVEPSRPGAVPVVYWQDTITASATACESDASPGSRLCEVHLEGESQPIATVDASEDAPGSFRCTFPPFFPQHGYATVLFRVRCADPLANPPEQTVAISIYIDPSGVVRTTTGDPIEDAVVTLLRSDSAGGPFDVVPDGSGIMSIANRANPSLSDAAGRFGWDVVAGFYRVRAAKEGCVSPADASVAFVESPTLTIPPPVIDLDLRLSCTPGARCGDGSRDPEEACDDGNLEAGDGCSPLCQIEPACGDGEVNAVGEECDDGNLVDGDGCSAGCLREARCGDGQVNQQGEECDDGNQTAGDGCSALCRVEPRCGDGQVNQTGEQCDDGNLTSGDGCSATCRREEICGNLVDDDNDDRLDCFDPECARCATLLRAHGMLYSLPRPGLDRIQLVAQIQPPGAVDPGSLGFGVALRKSGQTLYVATLAPGDLARRGAKRFAYGGPATGLATAPRTGLDQVQVREIQPGIFQVTVEARADLAASTAEMDLVLQLGAQEYALHDRWQRVSYGWLLR